MSRNVACPRCGLEFDPDKAITSVPDGIVITTVLTAEEYGTLLEFGPDFGATAKPLLLAIARHRAAKKNSDKARTEFDAQLKELGLAAIQCEVTGGGFE